MRLQKHEYFCSPFISTINCLTTKLTDNDTRDTQDDIFYQYQSEKIFHIQKRSGTSVTHFCGWLVCLINGCRSLQIFFIRFRPMLAVVRKDVDEKCFDFKRQRQHYISSLHVNEMNDKTKRKS